ncbi:hypothetical protein [Sandaracinus amylolyticus]|uniref:hypothetical protein n=1 Tax=Sandaracinus amylolyticus TaxID=927083 RepID=UPI001F22FCDC|nr:hypothetical protein [Sandaracinus amylolyticus]UJR81494.1 Hypothetical protein I5071_35540 [Sandaracinus amylolyticus]
MRNVVGVIAALLLVACANETVKSVPACECYPDPSPTTPDVCLITMGCADDETIVCERQDGALCRGAIEMCSGPGDMPGCGHADNLDGTVVCVSLDDALELLNCE